MMATKRRLQVFVSSTFTDLKDERQAAVAAILKAGHIPAGMELFTAGDETQMSIIKRWIDESDVYVLILGGRYGSIERSSGLSYTELEYNYAIEKNKALFAVVENESARELRVKKFGTSVIELDQPEKLKIFRSKVLENMSSFFDDVKDIKLGIHESLSDFATNRELKGWVAAGEVQDTAPLFDQIQRLSQENDVLREKLAALERQIQSKRPNTVAFDELLRVLLATKILVPNHLTSEKKDREMDLFSVFWSTHETFLSGITNEYGMGEDRNWLFFTVAPKLQIHGLVGNEKVAGAKYRRVATTKLGDEFLAYYDRRQLEKRKPERAESVEDAVVQTPSARKAVPTKRSARKKLSS